MGERVGSGEGEGGRDRGRKIGTEVEKNKLMSRDGENNELERSQNEGGETKRWEQDLSVD